MILAETLIAYVTVSYLVIALLLFILVGFLTVDKDERDAGVLIAIMWPLSIPITAALVLERLFLKVGEHLRKKIKG
jgi:hypothetical protein